MFNNNLKYNYFYILFVIIGTLPILVIGNSQWDGSIVNYSFSINDLSGLKNWFEESRWNLQYYLYVFIHFISNKINISEEFLIKIISIISIIGISIEAKKFTLKYLKIEKSSSFIVAYFVLIFPAWHVLTSSVMVIHILCIWFLLLGFRLIFYKYYFIFGLILILSSFQLNSNFMLLCGLLISKYISDKFLLKNDNYSLIKTVFYITSVVVLFVIYKKIFPPYGLYEGYNSNFNIKSTIVSTIYFMIYIIPLVLTPILLYLFVFIKKRLLLKEELQNNFFQISIILILIFASFFPYAAVGKYSIINDFSDWSQRQALLLGFSIPVLIGYLFNMYITKYNKLKLLWIVPLFISIILLSIGFFHKGKLYLYAISLENALKNIDIKSGIVYIKIDNNKENILLKKIRSYSLSTIFQKVYGDCGRIAKIDNGDFISEYKLSNHEQKVLGKENLYGTKYCMKNVNTNLITNLQLENIEKLSFFDVLTVNKDKNLFKLYIINEVINNKNDPSAL